MSNDQFRDLMDDKPEWREMIETRLLQFQFVDDYFMIPYDPMGKDGPTLDQLLSKDPKDVLAKPKPPNSGGSNSRLICPYLEKCTFGRKCKFYHPEREQRNEPPAPPPQSSTSPVGSRTPNASRSATPSPSPEKWYSRYGGSNRSSGEDLRQLASRNGSTDDLSSYHQVNGTVDIAELQHVMQGSLRIHDVPGGLSTGAPGNQATGFYDPRTRPIPPPSMNIPPVSIRSAPVFSSTTNSAASTPSEPLHQHRYTFPMAVLPHHQHANSRTHVITEQHHRQLTALTPQGTGGGGGVASTMGIPPLGPEIDPNVMLPLQHPSVPGGYSSAHHPSSGYHPSSLHPHEAPPPPSSNPVPHQGLPPPSIPGMFVPRDGWIPSASHYPPAPQGLGATGGGVGSSLIQAPPGYYPSSQGPPGYNSRGGNLADSGVHIPRSHSMCSSVGVPSTRTSPYHQYQQGDVGSHASQRHRSSDYGNISPQRRTSYTSEGQKVNGGSLPPQASTSSGYGGSPYYQDYNQQQQQQAVMAGTTGVMGRPSIGHQSTAFSHPSHHPLPSHAHQLPLGNERLRENRQTAPSIDPALFRKMSAVFPGCDDSILSVMSSHPHVTNFEELVQLMPQAVVSQ